jgi:tight adherence protein B
MFDTANLFYVFVGLSAALLAEAVYLLFFKHASYRKHINRRLQVASDNIDRESVLIQLRRERGLTGAGEYRLPVINFNRLLLQSGLTLGVGKLLMFMAIAAVGTFGAMLVLKYPIHHVLGGTFFAGLILPLAMLKFMRARRLKNFGARFPDAIDIIVRSLRAGHPVPVALSTVAKELPDPVGTEFGIVSDEITYGSDLETAMRDLYFRVGSEDLPLFVTAVAIQTSTGGNLGEILENLSGVIRQRFKMRRKIKALAAEGKASAIILSSLPIGIFAAIQFVTPEFYASVWHESLTKVGLAVAGGWMGVGNFIMYRLVNFKI